MSLATGLIPIDEVLGDVSPRLPVDQGRQRSLRHSEESRDRRLTHRAGERSDFTNLRFGQLRAVAAFTYSCAALAHHVGHVVLLAADEQMGRIYASRVIAMVTNGLPIGNRPVVEFPRDAIRQLGSTPLKSSIYAELASPCRIESASPQPARRCFADVSPEPLFKRHGFPLARLSVALRRAVDAAGVQFGPAVFARHIKVYTVAGVQ